MGIFFTDDDIQKYVLVSFWAAIMELRRYIKHLYRFLNEFFENRHAISVGIIFLFFILNISGVSNEKIHH